MATRSLGKASVLADAAINGRVTRDYHRWPQAQLVAEVGSAEVTRNPQVRALRAANKRLAQELDILKRALAIFAQPPP